jgi:hypothetical protein
VAKPLTDCAKGLRVTGFLLIVFAELNDSEDMPARTEIHIQKCIENELKGNRMSVQAKE